MPRKKKEDGLPQKRRLRPALTPEARENQLISLSMDVAEQKLLEGTASSQIIVHFLKLGTSKNELEMEKLRHETALLEAKKSSLEANQRSEEMYEKALRAFTKYRGLENGGDEDDY